MPGAGAWVEASGVKEEKRMRKVAVLAALLATVTLAVAAPTINYHLVRAYFLGGRE